MALHALSILIKNIRLTVSVNDQLKLHQMYTWQFAKCTSDLAGCLLEQLTVVFVMRIMTKYAFTL